MSIGAIRFINKFIALELYIYSLLLVEEAHIFIMARVKDIYVGLFSIQKKTKGLIIC